MVCAEQHIEDAKYFLEFTVRDGQGVVAHVRTPPRGEVWGGKLPPRKATPVLRDWKARPRSRSIHPSLVARETKHWE